MSNMTSPIEPDTRNIKLVLEYDGTAYAGWQIQPNAPTIQGIMQKVVASVMDHPVKVLGASRTDAGVHARCQVASFTTNSTRPASIIKMGLNALLPDDIRVYSAEDVPLAFHPRFSAIQKTYRYQFYVGRKVSPFHRLYTMQIRGAIDIDRMMTAAPLFEGTHDFLSFRDSQCSARTTVREISSSHFNKLQNDLLEYIICGNRFLHHMVRIIVGTLVWIGKGKLSATDVPALFEKRDRRCSGPTAPARGLFLEDILFKEAE